MEDHIWLWRPKQNNISGYGPLSTKNWFMYDGVTTECGKHFYHETAGLVTPQLTQRLSWSEE